MKNLTFRFLCAALGISGVALTMGTPAPAQAKDFACRTARVIVPWKAGGETDIFSRIFVDAANRLGAKPKLQVINISGQGGTKGAKEARKAKPDGCTIFMAHQSVISSNLTGRINFTWNAYIPVTRMTLTPQIIGAAKNTPYSNLKELQAYAKKHPNKVLAGASLGSTSHFALLLLADALGVDFKYISYEGTRERMTALLAQNIDIGQISQAAAGKYLKSNQMKALAILGTHRAKKLPDLKTAKEQGFNLIYGTVRGYVLPKGASKRVVKHYIDLFTKVAHDPKVVKQITSKGSQIDFAAGDAYRKWWEKTEKKWTKLAKKVGVYRKAN